VHATQKPFKLLSALLVQDYPDGVTESFGKAWVDNDAGMASPAKRGRGAAQESAWSTGTLAG
jgi:hypothetical protein